MSRPGPYKQKARVTLTSKGQITLPIELRRRWDLHAGDQLDFSLENDRVVVRKLARPSILTTSKHAERERPYAGRFLDFAREIAQSTPLQPHSLEEIDTGIAEAIGEHVAHKSEGDK
jgi:AbrB family looped-hinge helix DNA binding protein